MWPLCLHSPMLLFFNKTRVENWLLCFFEASAASAGRKGRFSGDSGLQGWDRCRGDL